MPVINGLFNESRRENNPLSVELRRHPGVRAIRDAIVSARTLAELQVIEDEHLPGLLDGAFREPPQIGPWSEGPRLEGGGQMRQVDESRSIPTTRYFMQVPLSGDRTLLETWPDDALDLQPVDAAIVAATEGGLRTLGLADRETFEQWNRIAEQWQARSAVNDSDEFILTTYFDLTDDELHDAAETGSLRNDFEARYRHMAGIVEAVAMQTRHYFEVLLPAEVHEILEGRRSRLRVLEAVSESLSIPDEWRPTPPELRMVAPAPFPGPDLPLPYRPRLTEAAFEDVLRVIRIWASAVEKYPDAFRDLPEDRVSDLLAATLNATVPGAEREVYSRGGKSDIYIRADTLRVGTGPEKAFVLENKYIEGREDVREAIQDQLMRYSPEGSPSAVFLAMSKRQRITRSRANITRWAREVSGFMRETESDVEGWPLFHYDVDGESLGICIATVALPPVPPRAVSA